MRKGILITFEGGEGSGKSTQIKRLYDYLRGKGRAVFMTREPGGTAAGDAIRKILLDPKNKKISAVSETLLYMASRAQLIEEVILPESKKGKIVLCDRWLDATVAYQGLGGGVDVKWIESIGERVTRGVRPALSLYLDLPVKAGLARARRRRAADRMEKKSLAFHEKVRKGFLSIARREPGRFKRIGIKEADTISDVHEKIIRAVRHVI
ncbi:MAG: dTMP kinase [Candidatus Omnitrophica bacterium]|nr:dTMP kinase [Candidatus Omnitrophota bacterium]